MLCKVCNTEFEGRSDAIYCSSKCRKMANRIKDAVKSVTDTDVTDNLVTDNLVTANLVVKPKFEEFELPDGFGDLPEDVRLTISRISDDPAEFCRRTTIALNYQRLFPNSVHRGVPFGLKVR